MYYKRDKIQLLFSIQTNLFMAYTDVVVFNLLKSSGRPIVLGSIQSLTEMSTRNIPGDNVQPARTADSFTAICEPIA
jgi:hypothetical protein